MAQVSAEQAASLSFLSSITIPKIIILGIVTFGAEICLFSDITIRRNVGLPVKIFAGASSVCQRVSKQTYFERCFSRLKIPDTPQLRVQGFIMGFEYCW